jgi:hypothetical protein
MEKFFDWKINFEFIGFHLYFSMNDFFSLIIIFKLVLL